MNRYAYVNGNPVSYADPTGTTPAGAAIGGRIGSWAGGAVGELAGPEAIPVGSLLGGLIGNWAGDWVSNAMAGHDSSSDSSTAGASSSAASGASEECPKGDKCKQRKNYCITFCQYELDFPGRTGHDNMLNFRACVRRCMNEASCDY